MQSKSLFVTEHPAVRNSTTEVPALLKQRVLTVRCKTLRLLYVLQLLFCQFRAPSRPPAAQDFSFLSKPVHPRILISININTNTNLLKKLFSVNCNAVTFLLETLEHCYSVLFVVVNKSAVPVFKCCKQCVTAVLIIRFFCSE